MKEHFVIINICCSSNKTIVNNNKTHQVPIQNQQTDKMNVIRPKKRKYKTVMSFSSRHLDALEATRCIKSEINEPDR